MFELTMPSLRLFLLSFQGGFLRGNKVPNHLPLSFVFCKMGTGLIKRLHIDFFDIGAEPTGLIQD